MTCEDEGDWVSDPKGYAEQSYEKTKEFSNWINSLESKGDLFNVASARMGWNACWKFWESKLKKCENYPSKLFKTISSVDLQPGTIIYEEDNGEIKIIRPKKIEDKSSQINFNDGWDD